MKEHGYGKKEEGEKYLGDSGTTYDRALAVWEESGVSWLCDSTNHILEPHGAKQSRGVSHSSIPGFDWSMIPTLGEV